MKPLGSQYFRLFDETRGTVDKSLVVGIIGASLGSVGSGLVTLLATKLQMRRELAHGYDIQLRQERFDLFVRLFEIAKSLPREWPAGMNPSRRDLSGVRGELPVWYFDDGGLLLAARTYGSRPIFTTAGGRSCLIGRIHSYFYLSV